MSTATAGVAELADLELPAGGTEPAWLAERRRDALGWARANGLPSRKHEDWRYTTLRRLEDVPFRPASPDAAHGVGPDLLAERVVDLGGPRLVFVNGRYAPGLSRLGGLPDGALVAEMTSAAALGDAALEGVLAGGPIAPVHFFAALNTATFTGGAFVHLRAGTTVDAPIQVVHVSDPGAEPLVSCLRSVIVADAGASAVVVESFLGTPGGVGLTNAVTDVALGEGARLEHHKVQEEEETAFHLAVLDAHLGARSTLTSQLVALGASLARHEVRAQLTEPDATVTLGGLYVPLGAQEHDNPVLIEHAARGGTSRQLYKGVMDGNGHGVFNGRIVVHPDAMRTDASQTNKNLLLSDGAEVDTRPRLEILADDVLCTHGAAVGQLDEEALFYLQARGIPEPAARDLLTYAFVDEVVAQIGVEPLRAWVETRVAAHLASGGTVTS